MAGTVTVTTEAQLDAQISSANTLANQGTVTILVNGLLAETEAPTQIALASGNALVIEGSGSGSGLNGEGQYRGLFVSSGNVTIENLLLENDHAVGGADTAAGGGGAGLGGGLAVASGGAVTLSGVSFSGDAAIGGAGGSSYTGEDGKGGSAGFGGAGSQPAGFGDGGNGALLFNPASLHPYTGPQTGGKGGFGGGGGGGSAHEAGGGGGAGGFGGGAGGNGQTTGATEGSVGGLADGGGGGGLGAGGDVFVQQGGSLLIEGGSLGAGSVMGGAGGAAPPPVAQAGGSGAAYGSAIFLQGNQAVTLSAASGQSLTVAGTIADETGSGGGSANPGAGTLVIGTSAETGTVVLTAADTYVGPTTILDGTLQLGNGGSTGSIANTSAITDNGALAVDESGAVTLSPVVSGTGSLVQSGNGTTVLTAAETFTGPVVILNGALQLGSGGAGGSVNNTSSISDQGALVVDRSGTVTLSAAISGEGGLVQEGSGTAVLTSVVNLADGVSITAGTLQIGNGGTTGSLVNAEGILDDATLAVDESGTVGLSVAIGGSGALMQSGTGTTVLTAADTYTGVTSITRGTLQIGNGGSAGSLASTSGITDNATLAVDESGTARLSALISGNGGLVQEGSGTTTLTNTNTYMGRTLIEAGTLELSNAAAAGSGAIAFAGTATLRLDTVTAPTNTITGFALGDTINLVAESYSRSGTAVFATGNRLMVTENGITETLQFDPTQSFAGEQFVLSSATTGSTNVALEEVACFCRSTRIATPRGEIAVEQLRVGDPVLTRSGAAVPLTWIGRGRSLVTPANPHARPIIVRAGALADGVPARDLYVTRGHSLLLDGVLIPVEYLVNDRSVLWDTQARVVEFYHLELQHHDVLLAEGAEAESYREDGNRHLFHNTDAPRHATHGMTACAPVLTGGPAVDRVWARLLARAAPAETDLTEDADLHLLADGVRVEGAAEGMVHRFRLERVPFDLRIGSRVCNPVRMGAGRDPRDLGVAVRRLVLRGEGAELVLGWDSAWLVEGFNGPEPEARSRWTTGAGLVPARALAAFEGALEVVVELGMTTRYPLPARDVDAGAGPSPGRTGTAG